MLEPELPAQPQGWPWPEPSATEITRAISLEKNSRGWTWKVSVEGTRSADETVAAIEEMETLMVSRYGAPVE